MTDEKEEYTEIPLITIEPSRLDDKDKRLEFVKVIKVGTIDKYLLRIAKVGGLLPVTIGEIIIEPESAMLISFIMKHCAKNGIVSNIENIEGNSIRTELNKDTDKMYR